jgi:tetratricopeptide (TPR) repeat protein
MENNTRQFESIEIEARGRSISGLLDQVESRLGKMAAGSTIHGLPILIELDEIQQRLKNYAGTEESIRAEKTQFEYVQTMIRSNLGLLLRQVGGPARLQALRAQRKPAPEQWWWYIDEQAAQQRRSLVQRTGVTLGAILAVAALLVVAYQAFLAPDADTLARLQHQRMAETSLMMGDIETALTEIEQALQYDPENIELLVMQAIGQELTGRDEAAAASFERLERQFESREDFLLQRAMYYNQFDRSDLALADALVVLESNPESTLGQYYAGMASENLGQYMDALEYYDVAYNLAIDQNQSTLAATIRMNMGMLMQAMPGLITSELQE